MATLRPTYRLLVGVPGRSNAFAISERLGMDPSVVQNARDRLSGDDRRLEDVVTELEDRRRALEDELKTAREATRAAEQAKIRVESDLDEARPAAGKRTAAGQGGSQTPARKGPETGRKPSSGSWTTCAGKRTPPTSPPVPRKLKPPAFPPERRGRRSGSGEQPPPGGAVRPASPAAAGGYRPPDRSR